MNGWFLSIIIIYAFDVVFSLVKHGEQKSGNHNFFESLIACAVLMVLIYKAISTGI